MVEADLRSLLATLAMPETMIEPAHWSALALWAGQTALDQADLAAAERWLTVAAAGLTGPERRGDLVRGLLQLAKALARRPGDAERAGAILERAAGLDAALAGSAWAQHQQRQGDLPAAIATWRRVIESAPGEASGYLNLARLYRQTEQPQLALTTLLAAIAADPSVKTYLMVAQRLDELAAQLPTPGPAQAIRIALVGNATLDHLQSYVKVACYQLGLRPTLFQGGFDQYSQLLLDPGSELYRFQPDVLIGAVHASRLVPELHRGAFDRSLEERQAEIDRGLAMTQQLLDAFTRQSTALVLWHNLVAPQQPALGSYDWRQAGGQLELFGELNRRLAALCRDRYRNVYIIDEDRLQARCGKRQATDARHWLTARLPWSEAALAELAQEYQRFLTPFKALSRKCIVLDLDGTLWGGTIGEDGLAGIQIGDEAPGNAFAAFQRELLTLWRRGILLAICSKNNPGDALPAFEQHPGMILRGEHFAAQRINWQPKEQNLVEIARELNIGLDSLVFIDDNPVERARVRAALPMVLTPEWPSDPAHYRRQLLDLTAFDSLSLTEEDLRRNQSYLEQKQREQFETSLESQAGSLDDYLAQLAMRVTIEPASALNLPRIAQLTKKTNQFNVTTRRYSEAELSERLAGGWQVYGLRVADRFGDLGLTGVAAIRPLTDRRWQIDSLLLSCRVMGRGVETALLAFVRALALEQGVEQLEGWFLPTAKNEPAQDCFARHRFELAEQDPAGAQRWVLAPAVTEIAVPTWLTVETPSRATTATTTGD